MNRTVFVCVLAGCGRIAFDPISDGGDGDGGIGPSCDTPALTAPIRLGSVDTNTAVSAARTPSEILIAWDFAGFITTATVPAGGGAITQMQGLTVGYNPSLAATATEAAITYQSASIGDSMLTLQRLTLQGASSPGMFPLAPNGETYGNVITASGSDFYVAFPENSAISGRFGAFVTRIEPTGVAWSVKASNVGDCLCYPAIDGGPTTAIVFDNDGVGGSGNVEIGFNSISPAGDLLYPDASPVTFAGAQYPALAASPTGYLAMYSARVGSPDVRVARLDPAGVVLSDKALGPMSARTRLVEPSAGGGYFVVLSTIGFTTDMHASAVWLDETGAIVRGPFPIVDEPAAADLAFTAVESGGRVVIFYSRTGANSGLWTRAFGCD